MPAQWPKFIKNVSDKLVSRNSTGPDHFGMFVANEYFNAVKTAQTPFGNMHVSGQKIILEEGFKKAFNMLFSDTEPTLEDKFFISKFDDLLEEFPKVNLNPDPLCDIEACTITKRESIDPFLFYQFFPTTCPIKDPQSTETESAIFGSIEINVDNIGDAIDNAVPTEVTMKVTGGDGVAPYEITYKFNGIRLSVSTDIQGVAKVKIPTDPGKYEYTFVSAIDSTGKVKLEDVNQTASITISDEGVPSDIVIPTPTPRVTVSPALEDENKRVEEVSKRILLQNDGSDYFKRWVINLTRVGSSEFTKKVKNQVLDWMEKGITFPNNLNNRIFQEEHDVYPSLIPTWLTKDLIIKYTYNPSSDKLASKSEYVEANPLDPGALFYANYLKNKITSSITKKKSMYDIEKDRFDQVKIDCINFMADEAKIGEDPCDGEDAYCVMADCIIKYWMSCATQPFKNTPPILPCNVPSPGIFTPVSYGSKKKLADDLRRAWNTGKRFKPDPSLRPAAKAVATAVAVAQAKHLKDLKFIYVGQLTMGTVTIPMIGFSPTAF